MVSIWKRSGVPKGGWSSQEGGLGEGLAGEEGLEGGGQRLRSRSVLSLFL